ncbi:MAG: NAD+ synthase [Planctomycetota bacterium]|nr:NAD+ synthase [Planctomycetota bacterium]
MCSLEMNPIFLIDCESVAERCARFIRNFVKRAGVKGVVLGLSGGVDSAVVATLSVLALGSNRVVGAILPYKTSSPDSREDALFYAGKLRIKTVEFDITPLVDSYFSRVEDPNRVRIGNFAARMRMAILFDLSKEYDSVVAGTGNRTERLLGYFTLYGDSACALLPIGGLYKTQVWQLARYLEVPDKIVKKTPTADLWKGQTDEGEMGISYKDADLILYHLVDCGRAPDKIVRLGFEKTKVERVLNLMEKSEFKRRPPPFCRLLKREYRG